MIIRILFFAAFILYYGFSQASIIIHNGLTHIYQIKDGQTYKGQITLENTAGTPQSVKLYLQDLSYQSTGIIHYSEARTNEKSNADWIQLNTNLLTLKAKEKTEILYEIKKPEKITLPGSYWSVIIVEPAEEIKPANDKPGLNISTVVRYAIQIITDYNTEEVQPSLKFENITIEKEANKKILKIGIANNGLVFCKPTVHLEMYDHKSGQKNGSYSSQPMGLLPNNSKSFFIDISAVPPGRYTAAMIAVDENENAFALNVELEIKHD
ncbi:WxL protein host-binding domain-containing protein [Niabella aquatica]